MYTGNNPSALRSRREITAAMMRLMQTKSYGSLSIKEIMAESGYSRQTFYQIFESKEEILEFYIESILDDYTGSITECELGDLCGAAKVFFTFCDKYKAELSVLVREGKSCILMRKCRDYLLKHELLHYTRNEDLTHAERDFSAAFTAGGMVAMLEKWLKEGEESPLNSHDMAGLVCKITGSEV